MTYTVDHAHMQQCIRVIITMRCVNVDILRTRIVGSQSARYVSLVLDDPVHKYLLESVAVFLFSKDLSRTFIGLAKKSLQMRYLALASVSALLGLVASTSYMPEVVQDGGPTLQYLWGQASAGSFLNHLDERHGDAGQRWSNFLRTSGEDIVRTFYRYFLVLICSYLLRIESSH